VGDLEGGDSNARRGAAIPTNLVSSSYFLFPEGESRRGNMHGQKRKGEGAQQEEFLVGHFAQGDDGEREGCMRVLQVQGEEKSLS